MKIKEEKAAAPLYVACSDSSPDMPGLSVSLQDRGASPSVLHSGSGGFVGQMGPGNLFHLSGCVDSSVYFLASGQFGIFWKSGCYGWRCHSPGCCYDGGHHGHCYTCESPFDEGRGHGMCHQRYRSRFPQGIRECFRSLAWYNSPPPHRRRIFWTCSR